MAYVDDLIAARDAAASELRAIRERSASSNLAGGDMSGAGVKPNAGGPVTVDHGEYYQRLLNTIRELDEQIAIASGGAETETYGLV